MFLLPRAALRHPDMIRHMALTVNARDAYHHERKLMASSVFQLQKKFAQIVA